MARYQHRTTTQVGGNSLEARQQRLITKLEREGKSLLEIHEELRKLTAPVGAMTPPRVVRPRCKRCRSNTPRKGHAYCGPCEKATAKRCDYPTVIRAEPMPKEPPPDTRGLPCESCGAVTSADFLTLFDGDMLCWKCLKHYTRWEKDNANRD